MGGKAEGPELEHTLPISDVEYSRILPLHGPSTSLQAVDRGKLYVGNFTLSHSRTSFSKYRRSLR